MLMILFAAGVPFACLGLMLAMARLETTLTRSSDPKPKRVHKKTDQNEVPSLATPETPL